MLLEKKSIEWIQKLETALEEQDDNIDTLEKLKKEHLPLQSEKCLKLEQLLKKKKWKKKFED